MRETKDNRHWIAATRGSRLALAQTRIVQELLERAGIGTEQLVVTTRGDRHPAEPISAIGGDGLFIREIEQELLAGRADIAVHSAKDLPYVLAEGTVIGAVPAAADPRDCLVTLKGAILPKEPRIGTGSPRRQQQLRKLYPAAKPAEIRGNVDTRLRKLKEGLYDGLVLARAGLGRLAPNLSDFEVRVLSEEEMIPAAGQGLLAVQCRADDERVREILRQITDPDAMLRFQAERYLFCGLGADCKDPAAAHARLEDGKIYMSALFDQTPVRAEGPAGEWQSICDGVLQELRRAGR